VTSAASTNAPRREAIAGPAYDAVFFVLSPLLCLAVAALLGNFAWPFEQTEVLGKVDYRVATFVAIWTYAHLFAVVFRSHANPQIFAKHRLRFTAVPLLALSVLASSDWALAAGFVLAMSWDVYHTAMQNFGLCRIYDARRGNDPNTGRSLDRWLNHVIYAGPIFCGASLIPMLEVVQKFSSVGWRAPAAWVTQVPALQPALRTTVIVLSVFFLLFYAWSYWRLAAGGYRISPLKIGLLLSTAFTSITAWGFLPPLQAFFVVNLFHGLQYFAIVWWIEEANIQRFFGLKRVGALGTPLAFLAMTALLFAAGALYFWGGQSSFRLAVSAALVVSLMHFWYDGFVWSVRRHEI
jgi:hypothetical protein